MREHVAPHRIPDRLKERPTWLLGQAAARASSLLAAGFAEHGDGLRGYHYRLLVALEQWGPESQADLGRDTGIDRSDVTAALGDLEALGLVERTVDPGHRRRKIVSITESGSATLRRLDVVLDDVQEEFLAPLSAAQREQFVEIMLLLNDQRATGS
ncbi:MarR family winged helix-turn-helix transcriptional regulator [Actinomadura harenae]|uniref:MarR family transcriptional regulator n=1 Tax=Actinomadura harenae TaxID=2483351 RepID=A0A3M2LYX0_9ACTN|nr:MarR family winged helix-turn-helix transcriptional regulator [Actinomadura harenae]RMI41793.1 MarR family transcriptional regulator [Actinomadura harenae]